MQYDYRVRDGQTLQDIATQKYGSEEQVFKIILANQSVCVNGIDTDLKGGDILKLDTAYIVVQYIVDYLILNKTIISTGNV